MWDRVRKWFWRWRYWLLIAYGAITTVTALIIVITMTIDAEAARSWSTTTGRIEAATVRTVHFTNRMRNVDRYEQHVDYSYAVAGHPYRSGQISWGGRPMYEHLEDATRDLERRYPVGRAVQVFYDPAHPGQAILEQANYYLGPIIMLPVGILLLGWGIVGRRRMKRAAEAGASPGAAATPGRATFWKRLAEVIGTFIPWI